MIVDKHGRLVLFPQLSQKKTCDLNIHIPFDMLSRLNSISEQGNRSRNATIVELLEYSLAQCLVYEKSSETTEFRFIISD